MWKWLGILVLAALVSVAGACSDDENAAVFSFANDDLCEWVTEADIADFVDAVLGYEATATVHDEVDPSQSGAWVGCRWEIYDGQPVLERGSIIAGEADPGDYVDSSIGDYDGGGVTTGGPWVVGHPTLSDGVAVTSSYGRYLFHVPPNSEVVALFWNPPRTLQGEMSWEEAHILGLGDHFVDTLGWLTQE